MYVCLRTMVTDIYCVVFFVLFVFVLCLVYGGVQHILFVFVLCIVYPMLPVSLYCPFLIVPLVSLRFVQQHSVIDMRNDLFTGVYRNYIFNVIFFFVFSVFFSWWGGVDSGGFVDQNWLSFLLWMMITLFIIVPHFLSTKYFNWSCQITLHLHTAIL
jgi:hypothetical protein